MSQRFIDIPTHARLMLAFRQGKEPPCPICMSRFNIKRTEDLIRAECQGCGEIVRDNPQRFGTIAQ